MTAAQRLPKGVPEHLAWAYGPDGQASDEAKRQLAAAMLRASENEESKFSTEDAIAAAAIAPEDLQTDIIYPQEPLNQFGMSIIVGEGMLRVDLITGEIK
jgi:hypothetical protein